MVPKLICLVRQHQWHNGWDEDQHLTVWTCKRCGAVRGSNADGTMVKTGWGGWSGPWGS